jgi:hypothetical protein
MSLQNINGKSLQVSFQQLCPGLPTVLIHQNVYISQAHQNNTTINQNNVIKAFSTELKMFVDDNMIFVDDGG